MKKLSIVLLVALFVVFGLAAWGCGGETTATTTATTAATTPTTAATTPTSAATTPSTGATVTTGAAAAGTWTNATIPAGFTPLSPEVEVNIAFDDAPGTAAIILADQLGYFKQVGIKIKYTKFASGADMFTSLANGNCDAGRPVLTASTFNGAAQGIKTWVVADAGQNVPGKAFFQVVIRKGLEGKVNDFKDLKGLKAVIASRGSVNELFLYKALKAGGLTEDDVSISVIDSFPDLNTALGNNAADVACQIEPLITSGIKDGILVRFPKDPVEYAPGVEIAPLVISDKFKNSGDPAKAFLVAYLMGARAYNDAIVQGNVDQAKIIDILTKNTFVQDPVMWTTMYPTQVNPDGVVDPQAILSDQEVYKELGLVEKTVDVNEVYDGSLAEYAVGVLGKYTPPSK